MRLSGDAQTADEIERRFAAMGAVVVRASGTIGMDRHHAHVVYVARSRPQAEALRDAERRILADSDVPPKAVELEAVCEMGRRLGYPVCCTEAFVDRLAAWPVNPPSDHPTEAYLAAHAAWVPRPRTLLNNLLLGSHARFITFEPCRFDCDVAYRFARAVYDAAIRRDLPAVRAMCDVLATPVVVDVRGARAVVRLDRERRTIQSATPPTAWNSGTPDAGDAALAARLSGSTYGDDGAIALGDATAVLVDFGLDRPDVA
jgi:hypothetical protein